MLHTLSVIGTGGHAAHADKCGVYIDGKKIVGDFGKGIDEKAKMNDFGQPFACIGGGKIGFGYGDQDVVLVNQDAFGNQCANSTRVYDLTGKNKNINEIGTVLNGEINVDEQATIRIVDMLIQQPQKKEEDENDS